MDERGLDRKESHTNWEFEWTELRELRHSETLQVESRWDSDRSMLVLEDRREDSRKPEKNNPPLERRLEC
jgi:hypothetical protein